MTFGLEDFLFSKNFPIFVAYHQRRNEGWQGGHNSPDAESLRGGQKVATTSQTLFLKTVGLHLLPKDLRFEHGGAKLVSFPRRHLTSLRPWTSRLSSQNDEICLQKYLPIIRKLFITSYLKQNAVDYRSHLTIENDLKVEKRYIISKASTTFHPSQKNVWGTRRDKHTKKTRKQ